MKLEDPDFESDSVGHDQDQVLPARPKGHRSRHSDTVRARTDGELEDDFVYEEIDANDDGDEEEVEGNEVEGEDAEDEEEDDTAPSAASVTARPLGTADLKLAIATGDAAAVRGCFAAVVPEALNNGVHVALPRAIAPCASTAAELVAACKAALHSAKAKAGGARHGKGQMRVLIVTPSAPRAASLCGILARKMHGLCVAKLFGRHLEVDAQTAFLGANKIDVAVGTPSRLVALARAGALDLTLLGHVMCDLTPDDKEQTFLSLSKRGSRCPAGDALAEMLGAEPFATRLTEQSGRRSKLVLAPVILPDRTALEAATPRSQLAGRGQPGGGRARGGEFKGGAKGGGRGRARGGARLRGAIGKPRPRPSAFASRTARLG
jgi:hypothetical protein